MKIHRTARNILSVTAIAWSIPFAQAGDVLIPETESKHARASIVSLNSLDVWIEAPDGPAKLTRHVRAARKRS